MMIKSHVGLTSIAEDNLTKAAFYIAASIAIGHVIDKVGKNLQDIEFYKKDIHIKAKTKTKRK